MYGRQTQIAKAKISKRRANTILIWFCAAFLGITPIFLYIGIRQEQGLISNGISTQATIIGKGETHCGKSQYLPSIIVQFTDTQGVMQTAEIGQCEASSSYFHAEIGAAVPIRYPSDFPSRAEIEGTTAGKIQLYLIISILAGTLSVAFIIWGIIRAVWKPPIEEVPLPEHRGRQRGKRGRL